MRANLGLTRMNYEIIASNESKRFIRKQIKRQQARLIEAIYALPDKGDIRRMRGAENLYRLRVGDFRIIYERDDELHRITVLEVNNCGDIY